MNNFQQMLTIADVQITTDSEGRFNLNALHKAHLAQNPGIHKNSKQPADWVRLDGTKELIEQISNSEDITSSPIKSKEGRYGGTFAHELLAISYAGWISPTFQLKVNQVFLDYRTGKLQPQFEIPNTLSGALMLAADQARAIEEQNVLIDEMKPKVEFHDQVSIAINAQTFRAVAKTFETGRNRFTAWLRKIGILMSDNTPYQKFEEAGYFRVVQKKRKDPQSGETITYTQTLITGKGSTYLHKKWVQLGSEVF